MGIILVAGKWLFALLCLLGSFGFGKAIYSRLNGESLLSGNFLSLSAGMAVFLIIWIFYFSRRESFWSILEHELTHALFALLFFKRIRSISAHRRRGGMVQLEGGNFFIALAPYFFPLFAMVVFAVKPIVVTEFRIYLNFLLGFFWMFHTMYLLREFHPAQPDIRETGLLFSIIMVVFFNLLFAGLIIASLQDGWQPIVQFLSDGYHYTREILAGAYQIIRGWLLLLF